MTPKTAKLDKELYDLHELWGKHDYRKVGKAPWDGENEPILMCNCGCFAFIEDKITHKYTKITALDWIKSTVNALKGEKRALFRAWTRSHMPRALSDWWYYEIFGTTKPIKRIRKAPKKDEQGGCDE